MPMKAVAPSQNCDERWIRTHQFAPAGIGWPLSWTACRASTIANEDIRRTKVETDVARVQAMLAGLLFAGILVLRSTTSLDFIYFRF